VAEVVAAVMQCTAPAGIVCLTGVSSAGRRVSIDIGATNRELVLENDVVFGSVNANAGHYRLAVEALERADAAWLAGVVTRRVPLGEWESALERRDDDVKVVIDLQR
jgi:threonine dehydrogenase-like Zn-dependent dehydrogenase